MASFHLPFRSSPAHQEHVVALGKGTIALWNHNEEHAMKDHDPSQPFLEVFKCLHTMQQRGFEVEAKTFR